MSDIKEELQHYVKHFKGKVVFCNCDDPTFSNFWKYFHLNFGILELKKLVATHYSKDGPSYKMEYLGGDDNNCGIGVRTPLKENGDFRSQECIDILKDSDIVVTNPPFSLFREYVDQLIKYNKKFIIIGNMNAVTYKNIFSLIKNNEILVGYSFDKSFEFSVPDYYEASESKRIDEYGRKVIKAGPIGWYTNCQIQKPTKKLVLTEKYDPERYPKYDNYDAINVDKVVEIPKDYDGIMGVPISFLSKYCPEQFKIIGYDGVSVGAKGKFKINSIEKYKRILIKKIS